MIRTKKKCKKNKVVPSLTVSFTRNRLPRPGARPRTMLSAKSSFLVPHDFNVQAKTDVDLSTAVDVSINF